MGREWVGLSPLSQRNQDIPTKKRPKNTFDARNIFYKILRSTECDNDCIRIRDHTEFMANHTTPIILR